MNPLTNVKNITKLNETELEKGFIDKKSWHDIYKGSAWIFIGGLPYDLTEGDILAVFSQYGEIVNINLVRDKKTGKTKGFCFLCYANQKSTVLAVDNFNGIKICGRTIRVDHVANYKPPKEDERDDVITKMLKTDGCAPKRVKVESASSSDEKEKKKIKKEKKKLKKSKEKEGVRIKKEKEDPGYHKYEHSTTSPITTREKYANERVESKDVSNVREMSHKNERIRKDDSALKYRKKKHKDTGSSSDYESTDNENTERRKTTDYISRTKDSVHYDRKSKHDEIHKHGLDRNHDSSGHETSLKSRDYKESERYDSRQKSRKYHRHDSSSNSEEDRSVKSHHYEESSNKLKYSRKEKQKHYSQDLDRSESNSKHKKHKSR